MHMQNSLLQWPHERILEEARALRVGYQLKRTLRFNTQRDLTVHSESVGEHEFGLFYLLEYFLPLEDPEGLLDFRTLYRIILFHDFPEIAHGDVPYLHKTAAHIARENAAAAGVFASLPESIRKSAQKSWEMYERRDKPEAQFAYALDKVEPMFELFDPINEQTPKRINQTYESHLGKKLKATENYPYMRKFVEVVSEDMLRRGVFWKEQK